MCLEKVYFVTSNKNKVDMFNKVIGGGLLVDSFEPIEEIEELESRSVEEVVVDKLNKAMTYFRDDASFLFVTDVGFFIDQINGPGALIKRETKKLFKGDFGGWCDYLDKDKSRSAFVQVIIAAKNNKGESILVNHKVKGSVPLKPLKGPYGFAWDDIFVPDAVLIDKKYEGLSFSQIPEDEKLKLFMMPPIRELKNKILNH